MIRNAASSSALLSSCVWDVEEEGLLCLCCSLDNVPTIWLKEVLTTVTLPSLFWAFHYRPTFQNVLFFPTSQFLKKNNHLFCVKSSRSPCSQVDALRVWGSSIFEQPKAKYKIWLIREMTNTTTHIRVVDGFWSCKRFIYILVCEDWGSVFWFMMGSERWKIFFIWSRLYTYVNTISVKLR